MKNLKRIILGMLLILPFNVLATTANVTVTCPSQSSGLEEVTCVIKASTSGGNLNGFKANYDFSEGLSAKFVPNSVWESVFQIKDNGFSIGNINGVPSEVTVGALKVTVPSGVAGKTYKVGLADLSLSDTNDADVAVTVDNGSIKIAASYKITYKSDNNGTVTGSKEETVTEGKNPNGTTIVPNKGYKLAYYVADKNVTLSDQRIISSGSKILSSELTQIVVNDDITITGVHEIGKYSISYISDEHGKITGITSEEKNYDENISGTEFTTNENYKVKGWTANADVTLKDGKVIKKGELITNEQLKEIVVTTDLILKLNHSKTFFTVTYKGSKLVSITGIKSENVIDGEFLKGTSTSINDIVWIANKNVTLKDGKVIKKGEKITTEQLKEIVLDNDLTLTAYQKDNVEVNVPDTGSIKPVIATIAGIALIGTGAFVFYKKKKTLKNNQN